MDRDILLEMQTLQECLLNNHSNFKSDTESIQFFEKLFQNLPRTVLYQVEMTLFSNLMRYDNISYLGKHSISLS